MQQSISDGLTLAPSSNVLRGNPWQCAWGWPSQRLTALPVPLRSGPMPEPPLGAGAGLRRPLRPPISAPCPVKCVSASGRRCACTIHAVRRFPLCPLLCAALACREHGPSSASVLVTSFDVNIPIFVFVYMFIGYSRSLPTGGDQCENWGMCRDPWEIRQVQSSAPGVGASQGRDWRCQHQCVTHCALTHRNNESVEVWMVLTTFTVPLCLRAVLRQVCLETC